MYEKIGKGWRLYTYFLSSDEVSELKNRYKLPESSSFNELLNYIEAKRNIFNPEKRVIELRMKLDKIDGDHRKVKKIVIYNELRELLNKILSGRKRKKKRKNSNTFSVLSEKLSIIKKERGDEAFKSEEFIEMCQILDEFVTRKLEKFNNDMQDIRDYGRETRKISFETNLHLLDLSYSYRGFYMRNLSLDTRFDIKRIEENRIPYIRGSIRDDKITLYRSITISDKNRYQLENIRRGWYTDDALHSWAKTRKYAESYFKTNSVLISREFSREEILADFSFSSDKVAEMLVYPGNYSKVKIEREGSLGKIDRRFYDLYYYMTSLEHIFPKIDNIIESYDISYSGFSLRFKSDLLSLNYNWITNTLTASGYTYKLGDSIFPIEKILVNIISYYQGISPRKFVEEFDKISGEEYITNFHLSTKPLEKEISKKKGSWAKPWNFLKLFSGVEISWKKSHEEYLGEKEKYYYFGDYGNFSSDYLVTLVDCTPMPPTENVIDIKDYISSKKFHMKLGKIIPTNSLAKSKTPRKPRKERVDYKKFF